MRKSYQLICVLGLLLTMWHDPSISNASAKQGVMITATNPVTFDVNDLSEGHSVLEDKQTFTIRNDEATAVSCWIDIQATGEGLSVELKEPRVVIKGSSEMEIPYTPRLDAKKYQLGQAYHLSIHITEYEVSTPDQALITPPVVSESTSDSREDSQSMTEETTAETLESTTTSHSSESTQETTTSDTPISDTTDTIKTTAETPTSETQAIEETETTVEQSLVMADIPNT